MNSVKFTCPKCASDRVARRTGSTRMVCRACGYTGQPITFKIEKRPSLKWDETKANKSETYE